MFGLSFWWLLVGYCLLIFTGLGIFLYGKSDGDSFFDKAYRVVNIHIPNAMKWGLLKVIGERGPKMLDAIWSYLAYECNPLVQIFYLFIIVGGYSIYVIYGYPHVPNPYLAWYHKPAGFLVFLSCLYHFTMCSCKDPGVITERNHKILEKKYFPCDQQIFFRGQICSTCQTLKVGRSKHCAMCDWCVARFDHHCIWVNNCVGLHNHYHFIMFLFWNSIICMYGTLAGATIMYTYIEEHHLFDAVFVDPKTRERFKASWYIIFQYLLATQGFLFFVIIVAAVMGVVLFGFLGWHLYLVAVGKTTNEMAKWSMLRGFLGRKYREDCQEHADLTAKYQEQQQLIKDGKEVSLAEGETLLTEPPELPEDYRNQIVNYYNKGLVANFKEVFFPINVHALEPLTKEEDATVVMPKPPKKSEGKKDSKGKDGKNNKNSPTEEDIAWDEDDEVEADNLMVKPGGSAMKKPKYKRKTD